MAEAAYNSGARTCATGNIAKSSTRRQAMALGAVGAIALAASAPIIAAEADAQFWALHREWKQHRDNWELSEGDWQVWQKLAADLEARLLACPIITAKAMLAKIEVDLVSEGIELPLQVYADARRIDSPRIAA